MRDINRTTSLYFRRQAPIGQFIVDFVEFSQKLIIEIDGDQHDATQDHPRTHWLTTQGFQIMRFWNSDVTENLDGVIQTILGATTYDFKSALTPSAPSPLWGRSGWGTPKRKPPNAQNRPH